MELQPEYVLRAVLNRAEANGYEPINAPIVLMHGLEVDDYKDIIFSEEFAKAFWKGRDWQWYLNQMIEWYQTAQKQPLDYLKWFLENSR